MPPEEEAVASKACGNKYKYCKKIVCRCPKQQKTTQRDQYMICINEKLGEHTMLLLKGFNFAEQINIFLFIVQVVVLKIISYSNFNHMKGMVK